MREIALCGAAPIAHRLGMSGKHAKKIRKANRHGGDGRGFAPKTCRHPGEDIDNDLANAERRRTERHGVPLSPEPKLEVLPGVPHRSYVPALGRQVTGPELTEVLMEAEKKKPTFYAQNQDRKKPKPWKPAGGTEFAHGQLRYDGLLAMRWGLIEGLPSPNGVLDSILRDFEAAFKAEYGKGYIVEAVCLHMPNPNLEAELKKLGWRGTVSKEPCDKLGRNDVHLQVYVRRLADPEGKQLVADITLFTHATDSVISSMQLRQLNVDLDEHRETKLETDLEKRFLQGDSFRTTGNGRKGKKLPPKLREQVDSGEMDLREAITKAINEIVKRRRGSMARAKDFTSLKTINSIHVARYEKAKAFDLWLSKHFTTELDKRLRELHPRYGELLDMAPAALRDVKQIQMDSKHKLLFNEALTLWERNYRTTIQRKKDDEKDAEISKQRRKTALGVQPQIPHWLNGLRAVMHGQQPPDEMLEKGRSFFVKHRSGHWLIVGGQESATLVVQFGLPEADSAKEFLELSKRQKAAVVRYDELMESEGREAAAAFLKREEASWRETVSKPAPPPSPRIEERVVEKVVQVPVDEAALIEKGKEMARAELAEKIEELQTQICDRDLQIENLDAITSTVASDHLAGIRSGFEWLRKNLGKAVPTEYAGYFETDSSSIHGSRLDAPWQMIVESVHRSPVASDESRQIAARILSLQAEEMADQFLVCNEDSVAAAVALVRTGHIEKLSAIQKSYFDEGFGLRAEFAGAARARLGRTGLSDTEKKQLLCVVEFASMRVAERVDFFAPALSNT